MCEGAGVFYDVFPRWSPALHLQALSEMQRNEMKYDEDTARPSGCQVAVSLLKVKVHSSCGQGQLLSTDAMAARCCLIAHVSEQE